MMAYRTLITLVIAVISFESAHASILFQNAMIVDGGGSEPSLGDVRVSGEKIIAIASELSALPGEQVIEAKGRILAPGFIDTHSHHDDDIFEHPSAMSLLTQGVTTIVVGQDGSSRFPLHSFFESLAKAPPAINIASYTGHGTIRSAVMGNDFKRPATAREVERMKELLVAELENGSLGLSTGLEYDPGIYSTTSEVIELAKVSASFNARYISHIRSEDRYFWEAIDETLTIARQARIPVQISHLKLAMRSLWGSTGRLLQTLEAARIEGLEVTADVYPYTYWQSTMTVLFPDRDFSNREAAETALRDLASPDGIIIARFDAAPEYVGMTLTQVAQVMGSDPETALMDLIAMSLTYKEAFDADEHSESIIATSMDEIDVQTLLKWPHANICSDGTMTGLHPRGRGAFAKVLGKYVREKQVLTIEEAIHKMTGLSARHMGLDKRGFIREGMQADLVLFDADKVIDQATPDDPFRWSSGVAMVLVNGAIVLNHGEATGKLTGQVIRRP